MFNSGTALVSILYAFWATSMLGAFISTSQFFNVSKAKLKPYEIILCILFCIALSPIAFVYFSIKYKKVLALDMANEAPKIPQAQLGEFEVKSTATREYYELVFDLLEGTPNCTAGETFKTVDDALQYWKRTCRDRKRGDGYDEYWNKTPFMVQKVTKTYVRNF